MSRAERSLCRAVPRLHRLHHSLHKWNCNSNHGSERTTTCDPARSQRAVTDSPQVKCGVGRRSSTPARVLTLLVEAGVCHRSAVSRRTLSPASVPAPLLPVPGPRAGKPVGYPHVPRVAARPAPRRSKRPFPCFPGLPSSSSCAATRSLGGLPVGSSGVDPHRLQPLLCPQANDLPRMRPKWATQADNRCSVCTRRGKEQQDRRAATEH